jgi:hypothetical protein
MTLSPFREVAIHSLQVREHRSLLTRDHLPKCTGFQAPRSRTNQPAPKPLTSSNRGAIALAMPRCIGEVPAPKTSAPPFTGNPVERVAGCLAVWANHSRPDPALSPADGWHRPFLETDLDLGPAGLDHDAVAGPGKPRVEGVG